MEEYTNKKGNKVYLFNSLESIEDAYFLGYMCGDGGYSETGTKKSMTVSSIDQYILKYFRDRYCPKNKLNSYKAQNANSKEIYRFDPGVAFHELFKKYGILCKKQYRSVVNIPKKRMAHYILGLFDADGSFSWGQRKDRNAELWCVFSIAHKSEKVLSSVQRYIEEIGVSSSLKTYDNTTYLLTVSSRISTHIIMDFLYKDRPAIYNDRKYTNYLDFLNKLNERGIDPVKNSNETPEHSRIVSEHLVSKFKYAVDGKEFLYGRDCAIHLDISLPLLNARCRAGYPGYIRKLRTEEDREKAKQECNRKLKELLIV